MEIWIVYINIKLKMNTKLESYLSQIYSHCMCIIHKHDINLKYASSFHFIVGSASAEMNVKMTMLSYTFSATSQEHNIVRIINATSHHLVTKMIVLYSRECRHILVQKATKCESCRHSNAQETQNWHLSDTFLLNFRATLCRWGCRHRINFH